VVPAVLSRLAPAAEEADGEAPPDA